MEQAPEKSADSVDSVESELLGNKPTESIPEKLSRKQSPAGDNTEASPRREDKKRKWDNRRDKSLQHGSRGKKKNMGRKEHFREELDRRGRNEEEQSKRRRLAENGQNVDSVLPSAFPQDEVDAEERRPKRKVAVMLGYSGTGYKGMQIDTKEKTIEGDLFTALVAAGAISKANADDPKKSSLVRCARTDKGVHAAGNIISLKLIVEDEDIVEKINSHLSPQIRIWGIQRTTNAFSCYQACDSRWYEYLIPTHSFLPPHPSSYLARKVEELADQAGDLEEYNKRQEEVAAFWSDVEEKQIKPILETLDDAIRPLVEKALYSTDFGDSDGVAESAADIPGKAPETQDSSKKASRGVDEETASRDETEQAVEALQKDDDTLVLDDMTDGTIPLPRSVVNKSALEAAIKSLKRAYMDAKRAYRIHPTRQKRVQDALNLYLGTKNYHNYTIQKKFRDPSSKRHIKSFKVSDKPIIINDTEWLSLKVHGQSFMMHQIRKMVGMAALAVRCGSSMDRVKESFSEVIMRIPKAPGLGLLLERPIFETYNEKQAKKHGREIIDFDKYKKEIQEFKQREIYERIFREESEGNQFNGFFTHIDNYRDTTFLYLTSGGIAATRSLENKSTQKRWEDVESENESNGEG